MKAKLSWLDDPEIFRINALPARSDHEWFRNDQERYKRASSYAQSLDGEWKILRLVLKSGRGDFIAQITMIRIGQESRSRP